MYYIENILNNRKSVMGNFRYKLIKIPIPEILFCIFWFLFFIPISVNFLIRPFVIFIYGIAMKIIPFVLSHTFEIEYYYYQLSKRVVAIIAQSMKDTVFVYGFLLTIIAYEFVRHIKHKYEAKYDSKNKENIE